MNPFPGHGCHIVRLDSGPSMSTCLQRKEEQKKREGREVSNCRVQFGTVTLSWAGGTMPTDGVMKPLPG